MKCPRCQQDNPTHARFCLGTRPLVAHCHFGLGKLYRQTNKREQAREHFATAIRLHREMDMRFWLEQMDIVLGSSPGNRP